MIITIKKLAKVIFRSIAVPVILIVGIGLNIVFFNIRLASLPFNLMLFTLNFINNELFSARRGEITSHNQFLSGALNLVKAPFKDLFTNLKNLTEKVYDFASAPLQTDSEIIAAQQERARYQRMPQRSNFESLRYAAAVIYSKLPSLKKTEPNPASQRENCFNAAQRRQRQQNSPG